MKKLPTPEAPPAPPVEDPILAKHHAALSSLGEQLGALEHLNALWSQLAQDLSREEASIESTVEEILSGSAGDAVFNEKSIRVASLQAQLGAIRKRAFKSGAEMQKRLPRDIGSLEWLCTNWLSFRLQTEAAKLLETLPPEKRGLLRDPAFMLAEGGIAYCESVALLGIAVGENYLWSRPLDAPESEKSALSQRLIRDPMFTPVDPKETLGHLLGAGRGVQARWTALLGAVGLTPEFELPSYEPPQPEVWTPPRELAGISSGPSIENAYDPKVEKIKMCWTEEDLKHPEFPQQQAG